MRDEFTEWQDYAKRGKLLDENGVSTGQPHPIALPDCDCHACALASRDKLHAALLKCAQATCNAQYQAISTTAHIALGTIRGAA